MCPGDRDYLDRLCRDPRLPWTKIPGTEITGSLQTFEFIDYIGQQRQGSIALQ